MNSALKSDYPKGALLSNYRQAANCDAVLPRKNSQLALIPLIVIALQILDGLLTITGTLTFGVSAEGNPILRALINHIGLLPAILTAKLACISVVLLLWTQAARIRWLPTALCGVAAVYAGCAVLPWSFLLISTYLC